MKLNKTHKRMMEVICFVINKGQHRLFLAACQLEEAGYGSLETVIDGTHVYFKFKANEVMRF